MPPPSSAGAWRLGNIQKWLAKSSSNLEPGLSDHRSRFEGARSFQQHGWLDPIGNHEFLVYVEDRNEPGTRVDRLWVELHDKDGVVIPVMSMDREASNNAEDIQGDNIVVPHGVKKKTAAKMWIERISGLLILASLPLVVFDSRGRDFLKRRSSR